MNKKLKIVSSLALAGVLVTSSLGMNKRVFAATNAEVTNPIAVFRNLVEGKTVVPFVLASKDDVVTVKDVVENDLFNGKVETINGTAIPGLDTLVKTGDRFTTTDGTEYTIIVYGDVDRDGHITALDALKVEEYNVNMGDLDAVQNESADVKNDARINVLDSLAIREYVVGLNETQYVIDPLPEPEEEVVESNYTVKIAGSNYVNNTNNSELNLTVSLAEALDKTKDLTLVISDTNKDTADVKKTVSIEAHKVLEEVNGIDVSSLVDGKLSGKLMDGEEVVATFEFTKNTVTPNSTNVRTNRTSTRKATLSLEKCGSSDISKVRYVVKDYETELSNVTLNDLTNSVNAENGKVTDVQVADTLETEKAYKVYFVLENQYGSLSEIKEAVISSDSANVEAEKKLDEVIAPDLTKSSTAVFTWNGEGTYVATLYKDGNAVSEKTVATPQVDFSNEMKSAGTYKVSVVVKARDILHTDSESTESKEVKVSKLSAVENVKIENKENGKIVLSWDNSNEKDAFGSYKIDLYSLDEEGKEVLVQEGIACDNDKKEVDITGYINANTIYVAKVQLQAKGNQMATISSDTVSSNQFYKVEAPNMNTAKAGTTSITFTINPIRIPNKDVKYKVEVYDVKVDNDATEARYTLNSVRDVTLDKNNQIKIDGLTSLNTYAFKLVAVVDGNEVKSEYSNKEITTLPIIENVTVGTLEEAKKENSGKIAVDGSKIVMSAKTFDTSVITELVPALNVLKTLKPGDVVTLNDNATNIVLKLDGGASASVADRDLGTIKDATVEIESNAFNKTITGTFKSLKLSGEDTIFTVNGVYTEEPIVLTDGVEVVGNKDYKVDAGATAIINSVKVSASKATTITASGKYLTLAASESATDLVFENMSDEATTIYFTGKADNTSEQKGSITIRSNGGSVKVSSYQVNVSADLNVEVNNGIVDISDQSLNGNKTVSVSADEGKTSQLIVLAKTKAPITMNNKELKKYTDEEVKKEFGEDLTQEEIIAITEYIDSFGLNGKGARITVNENSNEVTITVNGNVDGLVIGNLK